MSTALGEHVIVVSGLPRSGTSLMMQMLEAGGVPIQQDQIRGPDSSNERGYLEWEPIKRLYSQPQIIAECRGKAVKIVSSLLLALPHGFEFFVLFMNRSIESVLASQTSMITKMRGHLAVPPEQMRLALESHRNQVLASARQRPDLRCLVVNYEQLFLGPLDEACAIGRFLNLPSFECERLVSVIDPKLRHH